MFYQESEVLKTTESQTEKTEEDVTRVFWRKEKGLGRFGEKQPLKRKLAALTFLFITVWSQGEKAHAFEEEQHFLASQARAVMTEREFPKYELDWHDEKVQENWEKKFPELDLIPEGGQIRQSPFGESELYQRYRDTYGNTMYELVKVNNVKEKIQGATIREIVGIKDWKGQPVALFASGKKAFVPFSNRFIDPEKLDDEVKFQVEKYFQEIKFRAQEVQEKQLAKAE